VRPWVRGTSEHAHTAREARQAVCKPGNGHAHAAREARRDRQYASVGVSVLNSQTTAKLKREELG